MSAARSSLRPAPAPRYEQQEDDSDDQPGDQDRNHAPDGGSVPAEPSVVQGGWETPVIV